jgi:hypothetical protein
MKNKLILAVALMAFTFTGFSQAPMAVATPQADQPLVVSPLSATLLDLLKCIKMENISKSWTTASHAWTDKALKATSAADASALLKELSTAVAPEAFTNDFQSKKTKWSKNAAKVTSMPALKTSMKDFATGINSSAFIPEFNMTEWAARVDAL